MTDVPWIGCSECDCIFDCYNGETRCIRLPKPDQGVMVVTRIGDRRGTGSIPPLDPRQLRIGDRRSYNPKG